MNEIAPIREDCPRSRLSNSVEAFCSFFTQPHPSPASALHAGLGHLHALVSDVCAAETKLSPVDIRSILKPARAFHAEAPFVHRLQNWPRGYPGDFETIEWLVDATCRITPDHRAYWLEWYALNTPIAYQHRNKLQAQAQAIRMKLARLEGKNCRVLSVGCGGARDILLLPDVLGRLEIELADMDEDALALARERCIGAASVRTQKTDALRAVRRARGPFDLIIFGGLFDYLPDRYIQSLLREAGRMVGEVGGSILFTNISAGNAYRPWLEYLADWRLIERTHTDLLRVWVGAGLEPDSLAIGHDQTGLTFIAEGHFS